MYLNQQIMRIAPRQQLVEGLEAATAGVELAARIGDTFAYEMFRELQGAIQGELILRHNYATGEDLGQMSKGKF